MHIYTADSLSSTIIVYNYIKKNKNADLAIANSILDALDICAKNDLIRRKGLLLTSTPNYVDIFSLDFAFSFAITILIRLLIARGNNILSLITFIISYCLFADKLVYALNRATVMLIIILFISTTKIYNSFLKKNAAKSRILLICADRRTRQYYLTIYAILKYYNFNIYVSLATDTLHLLLKGLVIKMLDFITSLKHFNNKRAFTELIAIVSLLFISKAPFALHFIYAVYNLVILAQYKNIRMYRALDSICTRANSEAYYITIVKQFYSIINKKEYILQIYCTYSTRVIRPLPFYRLRYKRHNNSEHCDKELYLILIIIDYICYDKDRKHIAYIGAFSKVLLFNNNKQINNTTRMLSMPFKFYNLSTIICLVHLVLRDLPNLTTRTTISYYVNNYIN
ncbi:hypothetical protein HBI14_154670 [Parastagonospora nodorum]|nr:hypothetical protein HBI14_154670 [Parastagonospora nodorum]